MAQEKLLPIDIQRITQLSVLSNTDTTILDSGQLPQADILQIWILINDECIVHNQRMSANNPELGKDNTQRCKTPVIRILSIKVLHIGARGGASSPQLTPSSVKN